jgi:putative adhesin
MPTYDTPEPIDAVIEVTAGRVEIHASDRTDTVVDVRPGDPTRDIDVAAAEQTQVEFAGGQLSVRVPKNKLRSLIGRAPSVHVTIELPTDSRVDAKGWADYRGQGRIGECSIDSAVGSIRLDQTAGLKLRTAAGNVSVGRSGGHTDVSTSSGKIWVGEIEGTAVVKTANGDISVHRALAAVNAKTAYGSVRVDEVVRGSVVLETGFGELEIGVREGTAAWLDVSSQYGTVRSDLEAGEGPGESEETVEVRARTGYGDIVIRRP